MLQSFSSDVWHVLQSLPPHARILTKLRELDRPRGAADPDSPDPQGYVRADSTTSLYLWCPDADLLSTLIRFRGLFDPSCPYRLLYTLQILDSLLACEVRGTRPVLGDLDLARAEVAVSRSSLAWVLEFIGLGGAEHVLELIARLTAEAGEMSNRGGVIDDTSPTCDSDGTIIVLHRAGVYLYNVFTK